MKDIDRLRQLGASNEDAKQIAAAIDLRDRFAMAASMPQRVLDLMATAPSLQKAAETEAKWRYKQADAMLEVRSGLLD